LAVKELFLSLPRTEALCGVA